MTDRIERLRRVGLPSPNQARALYSGLTPDEFGRRAGGISRQTVHRLIRAGRIAAVPINPDAKRIRYRIPASEVDRYLRDTMTNPELWEGDE